MIRHIVMFKLKSKEDLPAILARAEELRTIPQVRAFQPVTNTPGTPERNYDFAMIFDFDSVEDLETYRVCDTHVAFGKFITPLRDLRASLDYEI